MRHFWDDLRFGMRTFRAQPGFLAAAVLTVALGVGANTVIFSAIRAILWRPLAWEEPDRLMAVWQTRPDGAQNHVSPRSYRVWRERSKRFAELGALSVRYYNVTGDGAAEQVIGGQISASLFPLLRARPWLGRGIGEGEDRAGGPAVAVLSHAFWRQRYGGRPEIVGTPVTLNGVPHAIIGVMPADFEFIAKEFALWTALPVDDERRADSNTLQVFGRLAADAAADGAQTEMTAIAKAVEIEQPARYRGWGVRVTPLREDMVGKHRPSLWALWGAAAALLLIAVCNVANLLLARGSLRQQEMAVRCALGATPRRLTRQLLAESLTLGVLGAALGLALAAYAVRALAAATAVDIPRLREIGIDGAAMAFTAAITVGAAVAFGLAPAWRAVSPDLVALLKEEGRAALPGRTLKRWQRWLVSCQIGVSAVLLTGAALLVRSVASMQQVDRGFRAENLLTLRVGIPAAKYPTREAMRRFGEELAAKLGGLPDVASAATSTGMPLDGKHSIGLQYGVEGVTPTSGAERPLAITHMVSPSYFTTLGLRLQEGRLFDARDRPDSTPAIIVSRSLARRYWIDGQAAGKKLIAGTPGGGVKSEMPREIAGVVDDIVYPTGKAGDAIEIYYPQSQTGWNNVNVFLRTRADPMSVAPAARRAVQELDPEVPVSALAAMEDLLWELNGRRRFDSELAGLFAALALLLTVVGVYGVIAYSTAQHTREIAVRVAIGAQPGDVTRLVMKETLSMVGAGLALGAIGYVPMSRLLANLVYGVGGTGPATLAAVSLAIALASLAASLPPAWRASRLDPAHVLHEPPRW